MSKTHHPGFGVSETLTVRVVLLAEFRWIVQAIGRPMRVVSVVRSSAKRMSYSE
jgi:hypothetical protein